MTNLLQQLLNEQQDLTAVERFSQLHAVGDLPAQQKYYSSLLPTSAPADGQQLAFNVDLDKCSGCKACVTACHSLNGLDDDETWRDVGLLIGGSAELPIMQHVTTACHHCIDPACASACPVNAYEKNPITGIVRHLDDQCFGCQYCTLACPYDVPKYNAAKGIVRKCDMCSDRLSTGEAPACVQACPHEAISIKVVSLVDIQTATKTDQLVPTAPESNFTRPTTIYSSSKHNSETMLPADYSILTPQHAHLPLVIMLTLTQLSVGMFIAESELRQTGATPLTLAANSTVALLTCLMALGASTCHLGRPLYAFRSFLGLKHSWLSREIVVFGGFTAVAGTHVATNWQRILPEWVPDVPHALKNATLLATIAIGLIGVFCSVKIYTFTRRQFWNFRQTATKFFLTCAISGFAGAWLTIVLTRHMPPADADGFQIEIAIQRLAGGIILASLIKLTFEFSIFCQLSHTNSNQLARSAKLMNGRLRSITVMRFVLGICGGVLLPGFAICGNTVATSWPPAFAILAMCLSGELLERYLFFAAVSPDRMPGGLNTTQSPGSATIPVSFRHPSHH